MKKAKHSLAALCALLLLFSLAACGSQSADSVPRNTSSATATDSSQKAASGTEAGGSTVSSTDLRTTPGQEALPAADKIVYSGSVVLETRKFDEAISGLEKRVLDSGGFIENSAVSGASYDETGAQRGYRSAQYTVRIPAGKFTAVSDSLKALGNVTETQTTAENITLQYSDTSSHLDALKTQEGRLLELLTKAQSMEDILKIEEQLSNVRYQIENLTSQLKNWDNAVSYSTLSVSIREVAYYTKDGANGTSYAKQLREAFIHSLYGVGRFFKAALKFLVAALPVLVLIALAALLFIRIHRRNRNKKSPPAPADDSSPHKPE